MRLVIEHRDSYPSQWEAIKSIATKIGCAAETLRGWMRQKECATGQRSGLVTEERQRIKALEWEVRELRQANAILRKALAFLPRRSSTAASSHEGIYRCPAGQLRGRAHLHGVADSPIDLLFACCPSS